MKTAQVSRNVLFVLLVIIAPLGRLTMGLLRALLVHLALQLATGMNVDVYNVHMP